MQGLTKNKKSELKNVEKTVEQTVQALKSCKLGLGLIFLVDDPA